jgi:hypothetical protein
MLSAFYYPYKIRKALVGALSAKKQMRVPQKLGGFALLNFLNTSITNNINQHKCCRSDIVSILLPI